jgi:hypothetical protein
LDSKLWTETGIDYPIIRRECGGYLPSFELGVPFFRYQIEVASLVYATTPDRICGTRPEN